MATNDYISHNHNLISNTYSQEYVSGTYNNTYVAPNSGYQQYTGHNCGNCGQWVPSGCAHNCYYYAPTYPHFYPPVQQIQYVPQPYYFAVPADDAIEKRLESLEEKVEKLLDLLLNNREEVRGHSQGGHTDCDSEGGTGTDLEVSVSVRRPKGSWTWPPRD